MPAIHLYLEGWQNYKINNQDYGYEMGIKGYFIDKWKLFDDYLTERNMNIIDLYFKIKKYGWPYFGGWAEQPARLVYTIMALDIEMEKRNAK